MQRRSSIKTTDFEIGEEKNNRLSECMKDTALQASDVVFGVDIFSQAMSYNKDVRHGVTKIMHYDFSWLLGWRYLAIWKDTAFSWHIVLWTAVSCMAATLVGLAVCPSEKGKDPYWGTSESCLPLQPSSNWLFLTTLIAFLLAIFTNMTLSRWWVMREKTGFCMGRMNNITQTISAFMPGTSSEVKAARETIVRYLNVLHATMYITFKRDGTKVAPTLHKDNLITAEESDFLETTPNAEWSIVLVWIAHTLRNCAANGWLVSQETMLPYIITDLQVIRGFIGDIMGFLTCQIPYPYVSLLIFITKTHIFLVHIYAAALIGPNIWTPGLKNKDLVVLGYVVLIFNCLIYNALLAIADMLYNPFGDDHTDFPVHTYMDGVKKSTAHTLRAGENLPAAVRELQRSVESFPPPPEVQSAPSRYGSLGLRAKSGVGQENGLHSATSDATNNGVIQGPAVPLLRAASPPKVEMVIR